MKVIQISHTDFKTDFDINTDTAGIATAEVATGVIDVGEINFFSLEN